MRRDAEIEEHAVDAVDAERVEHGAQIAERGVHELNALAEARQASARRADRVGVAVEPDQLAAGRAPIQDRLGVPRAPDRSIDHQ